MSLDAPFGKGCQGNLTAGLFRCSLIGMMDRLFARSGAAATMAAVTLFLYGCAAPADSTRQPIGLPSSDGSMPETAPAAARNAKAEPHSPNVVVTPVSGITGNGDQQEPVATFVDARPAAMIDGKPVNWGELRATMTDLAGADALREYILDLKLAKALTEANIIIDDDAVVAERKMLLESLSDDPNTAIRLLDELRDQQELGRKRFEALLRRNAGLRALVRGQVRINDDALRTMHDYVHGPKRQARIMILPDLSTAQSAINLVKSGVSFPDVAVEMSSDASAARGGLLEPISQSDPNYPEALRQTLFTLNIGEMSGPVLIGDKYAIVLMVKRIAPDGVSLEDSRSALERMVRINQERLLMDQLARRITLDTAVTVFDEELNDSWQRAKKTSKR